MNAETTYYCWIRLVKHSTATGSTPSARWHDTDEGRFLLGVYKPLYGSKPPNAIAGPVTVRSGQSVGIWQAVEDFYGKDGADTRFEFGPGFIDLKDAEEWIYNQGAAWAQDSINHFLLSFGVHPLGVVQ